MLAGFGIQGNCSQNRSAGTAEADRARVGRKELLASSVNGPVQWLARHGTHALAVTPPFQILGATSFLDTGALVRTNPESIASS